MQPDESMAQLKERISFLEEENTRLRARLDSCEQAWANQQLNQPYGSYYYGLGLNLAVLLVTATVLTIVCARAVS